MREYILTVGLEIHVEADTATKMFCRCANNTQDSPNKNICPVCLGLPGALPVPNQKAVEQIIKLGLALGGKVSEATKWDRKNYYYPDLPKGYQISQYDEPIVVGGSIDIGDKKINLTRIHLEEDTGKLTHPTGSSDSLIDLNRAGAPLIEMVSEPDLHDAKDAKKFCQEFQKILRHLNISTSEMEQGKMRCEANISVAPSDASELGTKVEVKNLNSFRAVERSIEYEKNRQIELIEEGTRIIQETRGWSDTKQQTYSQRSKESAHDYRYFPEPDIPRISISKLTAQLSEDAKSELPSELRNKLISNFNLTEEESEAIVKNKAYYQYFNETMQELKGSISGRVVASWMIHSKFGTDIPLSNFVTLLNMVNNKDINDTLAREIARKTIAGEDISVLLNQSKQIDKQALNQAIDEVLRNNIKAVEDYKAGKTQVIQFLFGQIMKATQGRVSSSETMASLKNKLEK